jgi:predicted alpha/beta superfamily hydrolase
MTRRWPACIGLALALASALTSLPTSAPARSQEVAASPVQQLVIGDTFTIASKALGETRRINVYLPAPYAKPDARLPVLYMPDGGLSEDFLHVAGLVQVSIDNGTMRPFILVGIENTQRRRDLTGPTRSPEDRKIAPVVGGSATFRDFIRDELMPEIRRRYRTTDETAIVGESLAGLFVVETLMLEPTLFDTYVALDPSIWWNRHEIVDDAAKRVSSSAITNRTFWFAQSSEEYERGVAVRFAEVLRANAPASLHWHYEPMPEEKHATIYHPAALRAFRAVFAPSPGR